ncbi:MAG: glutamate formiminotransferase [Actinomycetota bacterium]|nr:glutamate formiminotransferase [Actinomycetota bacterium]
MLECVVNVSEGRDAAVIDALGGAAGPQLLDVHRDPEHHRSVLTLAGAGVEEAARRLAAEAVAAIDVRSHVGAHPRIGAVDVVPFVPLAGASLSDAVGARDRFAAWAGAELGVPCFLYGPARSLPEVRRLAFAGLAPDAGPDRPHPTAGAIAVGARPPLVAYNLWLAPGAGLERAREVARAVRSSTVRALGLQVGPAVQVSCNLLDPLAFGPEEAYAAVAALAPVARAELVGLMPAAVLSAIPGERWSELDLDRSRTIEARLRQAGLDGGRFGASTGRGRR